MELPLTHPEYYEEMGIKPPKGVILYGPPGTGKTLLAKAVANQTSATFLRVVGSELIQKYLVSKTYFRNPSHHLHRIKIYQSSRLNQWFVMVDRDGGTPSLRISGRVAMLPSHTRPLMIRPGAYLSRPHRSH